MSLHFVFSFHCAKTHHIFQAQHGRLIPKYIDHLVTRPGLQMPMFLPWVKQVVHLIPQKDSLIIFVLILTSMEARVSVQAINV